MLSRTTLITAITLTVSMAPAAAEEALVFDLGPSPATVITAPPAPPAAPAKPAPRVVPVTPPAARPATGGVVARLGHIKTHGAAIYDGPGRGRIYNRCPEGQPIVLIGENDNWYGVRMVDGRTGWVRRSNVTISATTIRLPEARPAPSARPDPTVSIGGLHPILYTAFGYMGIPYKWGGTSSSGIDCSGFVQSVFKQYGATLPRVARDQARVGVPVPITPEHLRPGDRLYFKATHDYVDHTGIYWGDGLMIHSSSGRGVNIAPVWDGGLYERSLVSARRSFAPLS